MSNEILDLQEVERNIQLVKKDGDKIIMHDDADRAVAIIKKAEKQIEEAIKLIKNQVVVALEPFGAKTLRGKYCTISVSAPRQVSKYTLDEDVDDEFVVETIYRKANIETIEVYLERRGFLPPGVHRNEPKPVVYIRTKEMGDDI